MAVWCLATVIQAAESAPLESLEGLHLVAKNDFSQPGRSPWVVQGRKFLHPYLHYRIPAKKVGHRDPARHVIFDKNKVIMRLDGFNPKAKYKLKITYLSDGKGRNRRILSFAADGKVLQDNLALPLARIIHKIVDLPPSTYIDSTVELVWSKIAGEDVMVSGVEVWSNEKTLLHGLSMNVKGDFDGHLEGEVFDAIGNPVAGAEVRVSLDGHKNELPAYAGPAPARGETERLSMSPRLAEITNSYMLELILKSDGEGKFRLNIPGQWRRYNKKELHIVAVKAESKIEDDVSLFEIFLPMPRLTPQPLRIAEIAEQRLSLNGTWRFHTNPPDGFAESTTESGEGWSDIQVPGEWVMQGFDVPDNSWAGYRRTITVPDDWKGKSIKLKCDAVYSQGRVYINGNLIGETEQGGFTPTELDVTDHIRPGAENTIALAITNDTINEKLSFMSKYAQHALGGITRKIYLFALPKLNISRFHVETHFDKDFNNAILRVFFSITNESDHPFRKIALKLRLEDPDGKNVGIKDNFAILDIPEIAQGRTFEQTLDIPIAKPSKWDAEHPNLYKIFAELLVKRQSLETVRRRVGFRQVDIKGDKMLVNGRPIKLRGVERHELHPFDGRTLNMENWKQDIKFLLECNMNFVFTSHYPNPEEFLDLCDEAGLYVCHEAPYVWVKEGVSSKADIVERFLQVPLTMLEDDRSHPSIIYRQIGDECEWGRNFDIMRRALRAKDTTRVTVFAYDGGECAIRSLHYPSMSFKDYKFKQPLILDQFAHLNCYNRREILTDPGLRDNYGHVIADLYDAMYKTRFCAGGAIWSWIDDFFYLKPSLKKYDGILDKETGLLLAGYGQWGVVDTWRRTKPEFWHIKKAYSPIRIQKQTIQRPGRDGSVMLTVENRHDFTNLSELIITASLGKHSWQVNTDLAPRISGPIRIYAKPEQWKAQELTLKFHHSNGMLIDAYKFPVVAGNAPARTVAPLASGKPDVKQDMETIIISGKNFKWVLDRGNGSIIRASAGGSDIVVSGPALGITPLHTITCAQIKDVPKELQPQCGLWKAKEVNVIEVENAVEVVVTGEDGQVSGTYTMRFDDAGGLLINYNFSYIGSRVQPREIGLVFTLDHNRDILRWERNSQWSYYPDDHIGRPVGMAESLRNHTEWPAHKPGTKPPWPWELDSTQGGTADFRSSKYNIYNASLTDKGGKGLKVLSNGKHCSRTWRQGNSIKWLISHFYGISGEFFLKSYFRSLRRTFKKGTPIKGSLRLQLLDGES
jgi:beta-galactosidase